MAVKGDKTEPTDLCDLHSHNMVSVSSSSTFMLPSAPQCVYFPSH